LRIFLILITMGSHFLLEPSPEVLVIITYATVQRVGQILRLSFGERLRLSFGDNDFSPSISSSLLRLHHFFELINLNDFLESIHKAIYPVEWFEIHKVASP